jgi:phage shock protein C
MKKLYRSDKDSMIAGICGGIGETYDIDANLVRLIAALAAIITGVLPLTATYLLGWMILPKGRPAA